MKKSIFISLLFFAPTFIYSQYNAQTHNDSINELLSKNIFRALLISPILPDYETSAIIACNYEHGFNKNLTLSGKIGFGASFKKFGSSENREQYSYHLYTALEGRYFFSMKHRIKKKKSIVNYSGKYIGLEQSIITNPLFLINQTINSAVAGSSITFLNLGYQRQLNKIYLGCYFGISLKGVDYSKHLGSRTLNSFHGGLCIAYVF